MALNFRRLLKLSALVTLSGLFFPLMVVVHKLTQQKQYTNILDVWNYREFGSSFKKELSLRTTLHRNPVITAIGLEKPDLIQFLKQTPEARIRSNSKKKQDKQLKTSLKTELESVSKEEYERFFRPNKRINPFKYDFVINGSAICNNSSPFLIILIPSIPNNKEVRNAIRTTWGSIAKGGVWPRKSVNVKIKLAFLLGMSDPENLTLTKLINEESTTYGDLIEGNFTDSYYNLTLKILLGLKWVTLFCNNANFLVKADEDTFVNLPKLVEVLERQYIGPEGKILGCISLHSPVLRSGKWKLDKSLYPFPRYPKYVSGCSYFISINVVPRLFQISEYFPYISIEDAFITGMLAKSVNTAVAALPGVTYWGEKLARSCDFVLDKKISGLVNIKRLHAIWKKMNSKTLRC